VNAAAVFGIERAFVAVVRLYVWLPEYLFVTVTHPSNP